MVFALRSVALHFIGRSFTCDRIVMRLLMRRYVLSVSIANLTVRQQIVFRLNILKKTDFLKSLSLLSGNRRHETDCSCMEGY